MFLVSLFTILLFFTPLEIPILPSFCTRFLTGFKICSAEIVYPFQGEVNVNNINVRCDSTTSSQIICTVNKGDLVDVILELYEWYKIRLPQTAHSYIKKSMADCINYKTIASAEANVLAGTKIQCQNAKILKKRVNVRLRPNESSQILGIVNKNEVINILEEKGEWYRIEPIQNSFGWIHKRFVNKVNIVNPARKNFSNGVNKADDTKLVQKLEENDKNKISGVFGLEENIVLEGIIKPYGKIIKRIATHKLITQDNKTFLLKGNKKSLDALNYHKVKIIGKRISSPKQKYSTIEVKILEVIN